MQERKCPFHSNGGTFAGTEPLDNVEMLLRGCDTLEEPENLSPRGQSEIGVAKPKDLTATTQLSYVGEPWLSQLPPDCQLLWEP